MKTAAHKFSVQERAILVKARLQGYTAVWWRAVQSHHVACPFCKAQPGEWCVTVGKERPETRGAPHHQERSDAAGLPNLMRDDKHAVWVELDPS